MSDEIPIPNTVSEMFPGPSVPPFIRVRTLVGEIADREQLDGLLSDGLAKYANMLFRIAGITADFNGGSFSWKSYVVGEKQENQTKINFDIRPEEKDGIIDILKHQAAGVFGNYFRDPGAVNLAKEVEENIQILFQ